jgi:hypothetical protein
MDRFIILAFIIISELLFITFYLIGNENFYYLLLIEYFFIALYFLHFFKSTINFKSLKKELPVLLLLFVLVLFLQFWNLDKWRIMDIDEFHMIEFLNKIDRLKWAWSPTSTYYVGIFFEKAFFFINSFPQYRYPDSLASLAGMIILYFAMKSITKNKFLVFLGVLAIAVSSWILFLTRRFTIDGLDIFFMSLILYSFFNWVKTNDKKFFTFLSVVSALALNNHGIFIFILIPIFLWIFYKFISKKISFKDFSIFLILFIIVSLPYPLVFLGDLTKFYNLRYGKNFSGTSLFPNVFDFTYFIKMLSYFLFYENLGKSDIGVVLTLIIIVIPFIIFIFNKRRNELLLYFCLSYGSLFAVLISPVPAYNVSYFIPFLISFVIFVIKNYDLNKNELIKSVLIIILIILIFFSIAFDIEGVLFKNPYYTLKSIWPANVTKLTIEKTDYEILKHVGVLENINQTNIFQCNQNGIFSINFNKVDNSFFQENEFLSSDLFVISDYSVCFLYDYFSLGNLPIKPLEKVDSIHLFTITST